ncbi:DUF1287 domain-containing protein [Halalkalibacter alkalisediminis]|uniref:DUF1287 domain-containing protein n=1 Tax=Halalkalibacter alkalisediminis TaxID=935616 RepID=A0ABV6NHS6_9BACI|nr:DUF1287 domain-containing protein [Halalkalibacter alkalisediminis]
MKRTFARRLLFVLILTLLLFTLFFRDGIILDSLGVHMKRPFGKVINMPEEYSNVDKNNNGIPDPIDIVQAARKEVEQRTTYKSTYYAGGYPPNDEGVCTDVIWRGLLGAGVVLKDLIDQDISENTALYPRVAGTPDANIDFRRVPNQFVYFDRFTESLTTDLIPKDINNLKEWQPGDIVVFIDGFHHVGIVSDKRDKDGVPYLIHNNRPFAAEVKLSSFTTPIAGHYRWNY